ncbi:phosphopantetheine-binding protein, partial [Pandoraea sp. NPDC087047]|uniref:phosphopantetheine-binding protein n=1 Tax=Pandoraea sp. NPDC087047 TaxID=3364390 RepID=UPI00381D6BAA
EVEARTYEAPQGEVEQALAAVWAEVLGIERVGRHDNFFELGGHSLALVRVNARLTSRHGWDIPMRQIFDHPTIGAIAQHVPAAQGADGGHRQQRLSLMDSLLNELEV